MPSLEERKQKWFIDTSIEGQLPPQTRHPGSQLKPHTDGNLVAPVIDGAALMAEFNERVDAILNAPDPSQYELWIAQWRLDPVKLLGQRSDGPDAESKIIEAAQAGVKVFYLASGHTGRGRPNKAFLKKLIAAGGQGAGDQRLPLYGSQHQKFYIFRGPHNNWTALSGSADLNDYRWDTPDHVADNPDRAPDSEGPSHDVTLRVQGPAVYDIALTFAERWNDPANRRFTYPQLGSSMSTDFLAEPLPSTGPHSVQVLRTYGHSKLRGYSWSAQGEFTIWAAYLNAIKKAQQYIYMEDQYFYAFNAPPTYETGDTLREADIVYQLGEALKRGVNVILLVPSRKGNRNLTVPFQSYHRRQSAQYLQQISQTVAGAGRFAIFSLAAGEVDPVIHAKLMIVDDEFALVGSANVCRRSMAYDSEIHLGVLDAENQFARNLRLVLWQEHLDLDSPDHILDPTAGLAYWQDHAENERGRVRVYATEPGDKPFLHNVAMSNFIDPYSGPK